MRKRHFLAALALGALVGCGGDDSPAGETFDDTAAATAISSQQAQPIVHSFTDAGKYTLTLTGSYAGPTDTLQVWWSFSGQGTTDGNAEPFYTVTNGSAAVNQSIDVTLTGNGPWQLTIATQVVGTTAGTLTNLKLHGVKH